MDPESNHKRHDLLATLFIEEQQQFSNQELSPTLM